MPYDIGPTTTVTDTPRDRLIRVRDFIKANPNEFDYRDGRCCVLGVARSMMPEEKRGALYTTGAWLGLGMRQSEAVFRGGFDTVVGLAPPPSAAHAVRMINHLLNTGRVSWWASLWPWIKEAR